MQPLESMRESMFETRRVMTIACTGRVIFPRSSFNPHPAGATGTIQPQTSMNHKPNTPRTPPHITPVRRSRGTEGVRHLAWRGVADGYTSVSSSSVANRSRAVSVSRSSLTQTLLQVLGTKQVYTCLLGKLYNATGGHEGGGIPSLGQRRGPVLLWRRGQVNRTTNHTFITESRQ